MLNFFKDDAVKHIKPQRNAVIITYDENRKPRVNTECKDYDMEYFLVERAREFLHILKHEMGE